LDKKFASIKLVADVIKTLGASFDVLSKNVLQNKQDIEDIKARIKRLEDKR
jgi:predicted  nucleic acid-binding Zn-ribbon protein